MRVRSAEWGMRNEKHITPHSQFPTPNFLVVCLVLSITSLASAAPTNYERTAEQLSQAVGLYKDLSKQQSRYDVAFRRDPMRPLVDAQGNLTTSAGLRDGLSVQGIFWSEGRPLVVIEDQLFAQGDTIDQYTIKEIHRDGVVVQSGSETQTIPLDRGLDATGNPSP